MNVFMRKGGFDLPKDGVDRRGDGQLGRKLWPCSTRVALLGAGNKCGADGDGRLVVRAGTTKRPTWSRESHTNYAVRARTAMAGGSRKGRVRRSRIGNPTLSQIGASILLLN